MAGNVLAHPKRHPATMPAESRLNRWPSLFVISGPPPSTSGWHGFLMFSTCGNPKIMFCFFFWGGGGLQCLCNSFKTHPGRPKERQPVFLYSQKPSFSIYELLLIYCLFRCRWTPKQPGWTTCSLSSRLQGFKTKESSMTSFHLDDVLQNWLRTCASSFLKDVVKTVTFALTHTRRQRPDGAMSVFTGTDARGGGEIGI